MNKLELLDHTHDRAAFDCGSEPLNRFVQQVAKQHLKRGISRTFVLVSKEAEEPKPILGFFSLSACEGDATDLPASIAKKLPRKIPAVRLGRLAVSKEAQGQGIGSGLLALAMRHTANSAEFIGVSGMFVDAKDERAAEFYQKFGFLALPEKPLTLFLPIETVRRLLSSLHPSC